MNVQDRRVWNDNSHFPNINGTISYIHLLNICIFHLEMHCGERNKDHSFKYEAEAHLSLLSQTGIMSQHLSFVSQVIL